MPDVIRVSPVPQPEWQAFPSNSTSIAYEASRIVKSSRGILYGFTGYNSKGSAQFIQVFDANSLPGDGTVPVITFTVAASSNFSQLFNEFGRRFFYGIVICNSSTGPTKTIGSADIFLDVQFQ